MRQTRSTFQRRGHQPTSGGGLDVGRDVMATKRMRCGPHITDLYICRNHGINAGKSCNGNPCAQVCKVEIGHAYAPRSLNSSFSPDLHIRLEPETLRALIERSSDIYYDLKSSTGLRCVPCLVDKRRKARHHHWHAYVSIACPTQTTSIMPQCHALVDPGNEWT